MDPVVQILQENANNRAKGTVAFSQTHSGFCDPDYGQTKAKFALFSYIPNHIQYEKNVDLFAKLHELKKIDDDTRELLTNMFGKPGKTFPGVGRIRGCFKTLKDATRRAEYLVNQVDPFTSVMICMVGVPFPLVEGGHSTDTKLADDAVDGVVKKDIAKKRLQQEKRINDMKKREQAIIAEQTTEATPLDNYIQKRVKFAQITSTLEDMKKKLTDYSGSLDAVIEEIKTIETERPDLKHVYLESYKDACKQVGIVPSEGFLELLTKEF